MPAAISSLFHLITWILATVPRPHAAAALQQVLLLGVAVAVAVPPPPPPTVPTPPAAPPVGSSGLLEEAYLLLLTLSWDLLPTCPGLTSIINLVMPPTLLKTAIHK